MSWRQNENRKKKKEKKKKQKRKNWRGRRSKIIFVLKTGKIILSKKLSPGLLQCNKQPSLY
jgi:hypothetical protein